MGIGRRKFWRQSRLLLAVVLLDGALLGAFAGLVNAGAGNPSAADVQPEPARQASSDEDAVLPYDKVIALTFDDGPHQQWTAKLLDGLKARDVKASFFLMGENIAGKEDLVRRMQADGHLIGNHSFRHIPLTKASTETVCQVVEDTERLIEEITGARPQYLRPPYGDWNEDLECRMNLTTVLWTLDSLDWKLRNTDAIVRRVEQSVKNGDIILMHDVFSTSVEAALLLIDHLQAQGYHFVTVDELVID